MYNIENSSEFTHLSVSLWRFNINLKAAMNKSLTKKRFQAKINKTFTLEKIKYTRSIQQF